MASSELFTQCTKRATSVCRTRAHCTSASGSGVAVVNWTPDLRPVCGREIGRLHAKTGQLIVILRSDLRINYALAKPAAKTGCGRERCYVMLSLTWRHVGSAVDDLRDGIFSWRLSQFLAWQDIKQRYRRSTLGPIWLTLSFGIQILTMGVLSAVAVRQRDPEIGALCLLRHAVLVPDHADDQRWRHSLRVVVPLHHADQVSTDRFPDAGDLAQSHRYGAQCYDLPPHRGDLRRHPGPEHRAVAAWLPARS